MVGQCELDRGDELGAVERNLQLGGEDEQGDAACLALDEGILEAADEHGVAWEVGCEEEVKVTQEQQAVVGHGLHGFEDLHRVGDAFDCACDDFVAALGDIPRKEEPICGGGGLGDGALDAGLLVAHEIEAGVACFEIVGDAF